MSNADKSRVGYIISSRARAVWWKRLLICPKRLLPDIPDATSYGCI